MYSKTISVDDLRDLASLYYREKIEVESDPEKKKTLLDSLLEVTHAKVDVSIEDVIGKTTPTEGVVVRPFVRGCRKDVYMENLMAEQMDLEDQEKAATALTLQDINILDMETTEWGTRLLVEFKWWFGDSPGENRWQRLLFRTDNSLPTDLVHLQIIKQVQGIRERIEEQTGVSQDVRH